MSVLFKVQGKVVTPKTETLVISPFKEIWERDESPSKERAMDEFKFIEFTTSMMKSNPFAGYDEGVKEMKIIDQCITYEDFDPNDELIIQAQKSMVDFQNEASATYSYYMAAKVGAEKMKGFFINFDMNEVNLKNGNPIYKPRDITSALNDTANVLSNLDKLKKKVEEEVYEEVKRRGQKSISPFANPDTM